MCAFGLITENFKTKKKVEEKHTKIGLFVLVCVCGGGGLGERGHSCTLTTLFPRLSSPKHKHTNTQTHTDGFCLSSHIRAHERSRWWGGKQTTIWLQLDGRHSL